MTLLRAVLVLAGMLVGAPLPPGGADAATDAVLALGAFAEFNQMFWPYPYWGYGYGWPYGYAVRPYGYPHYPYAYRRWLSIGRLLLSRRLRS
jgi:hypothetical protein